MWLLLLALFLAPLAAVAQPSPGASVGTPTGTLNGVAAYCWNGSAMVACGAAGTRGTVAAVTPVVSGALEASHVLKNAAGTLYSVYASNLTGAGAGFLLVHNATAKPGDGAVTPIICVPFSGGVAQASYVNMPPGAFSTGITAVVSTATTCFTQTSSTATAFISGLVN